MDTIVFSTNKTNSIHPHYITFLNKAIIKALLLRKAPWMNNRITPYYVENAYNHEPYESSNQLLLLSLNTIFEMERRFYISIEDAIKLNYYPTRNIRGILLVHQGDGYPAYNIVFPCSEMTNAQENDSVLEQKTIDIGIPYAKKPVYDQVVNPYSLFEKEFCNYLSCAFLNQTFECFNWTQEIILSIIEASNDDPLFFLKCSKKAFEKAIGRVNQGV